MMSSALLEPAEEEGASEATDDMAVPAGGGGVDGGGTRGGNKNNTPECSVQARPPLSQERLRDGKKREDGKVEVRESAPAEILWGGGRGGGRGGTFAPPPPPSPAVAPSRSPSLTLVGGTRRDAPLRCYCRRR